MMEENKRPSRCQIDRRLVPIKVLNFVFSAATGCLLVFIPVFMKQLGLTSMEIGIIYGCMPFVSFFVSPLFGMVADKTRQHKLVMVIGFTVVGVFFNLLLLVPSKQTYEARENVIKTRMRCGQTGAYFWNYDNVNTSSSLQDIKGNTCDLNINDLIYLNKTRANAWYEVLCQASNSSGNKCVGNFNCTKVDEQNIDGESLSISNETSHLLLLSVDFKDMAYKHDNCNGTKMGLCTRHDITKFEFGTKMFSTLKCSFISDYDCKISYKNKYRHCSIGSSETIQTFYLCFLFFTIASVVQASMVNMLDGLIYSYLGEERRADYGKQRMWGTIGYILAAPISSTIMDLTSSSKMNINFQGPLHIHLGLMVLSAIIVFLIPIKEIKTVKFLDNVAKLFKYPEIVVFLVVNMLIGLLNVLFQVFLFLYLKSLNSPQTVLGLALVASCIPETFMFGLSGKLIKKIGCVSCLYISILALAIRYISYSFLTNPWYVLFIEPLHALSYSLMLAATTAYSSEMVPKGMSATAQGIRGGFQTGLGKGIGGLLAGKLFDPSGLGAVWTFRVYAIVCVVLVLAYATIQSVFFRKTVKASTDRSESNTSKDQEVCENLMTKDLSTEIRFVEEQNT